MKNKIHLVSIEFLIILLSIIFTGNAYTQETNTYALHIGDTAPNLQLPVLNYKNTTVHLDDFRGKMVILDFWSTLCSVCIGQLPKMDSLQRQFGDKLVVLPVGFDMIKQGEIKNFLIKRKKENRAINLPVAVQEFNNSTLRKMFPSIGFPHEIWIDKNGMVVAITGHLAVTAENIQALLDGERPILPDDILDQPFDKQESLLTNGNGGGDTAFLCRSVITRFNKNIHNGDALDSDGYHTRLSFYNISVPMLLRTAYINSRDAVDPGLAADGLGIRIFCAARDSNRLNLFKRNHEMNYLEADSFNLNNLYCYEVILPARRSFKDAYTIMLADVEKYFELSIDTFTIPVPCLSLVRSSTKDKLRTGGGKADEIYSDDGLSVQFINRPMEELRVQLNGVYSVFPIVDKTGYSNNIDASMQLPENADLGTLKAVLKPYDLDLIPAIESLKMLVIKDNY